ncbi:hypothetical protein ABZ078_02180 [Streptomyces sp. NPDC006385]|uniref:hypothetical protein n=1 Tax=Streptomyces sp. NPDC006385 TaxID=3156761 RepID=UPI0033B0395C
MPFSEKPLTVPPPIEVAGRHVKRYHVTADPAGIAPEVEKAAYEILPELLPEPDGTPPATFVGELPPILHERDAWVRHLLAPRVPDLDAYLADSLPEGTTGDRS